MQGKHSVGAPTAGVLVQIERIIDAALQDARSVVVASRVCLCDCVPRFDADSARRWGSFAEPTLPCTHLAWAIPRRRRRTQVFIVCMLAIEQAPAVP